MIDVTIVVDNKDVLNKFHRLQVNVPKKAGDLTYEIGKIFEREFRISILNKRLIWRGILYNRTKAYRTAEKASVVMMPIHGLQLDSMSPHWVSLKRGRDITAWTITAQNSPYRGTEANKLPQAIPVRPHPFIQESITNAIPKMNELIRTRMHEAVENS